MQQLVCVMSTWRGNTGRQSLSCCWQCNPRVYYVFVGAKSTKNSLNDRSSHTVSWSRNYRPKCVAKTWKNDNESGNKEIRQVEHCMVVRCRPWYNVAHGRIRKSDLAQFPGGMEEGRREEGTRQARAHATTRTHWAWIFHTHTHTHTRCLVVSCRRNHVANITYINLDASHTRADVYDRLSDYYNNCDKQTFIADIASIALLQHDAVLCRDTHFREPLEYYIIRFLAYTYVTDNVDEQLLIRHEDNVFAAVLRH